MVLLIFFFDLVVCSFCLSLVIFRLWVVFLSCIFRRQIFFFKVFIVCCCSLIFLLVLVVILSMVFVTLILEFLVLVIVFIVVFLQDLEFLWYTIMLFMCSLAFIVIDRYFGGWFCSFFLSFEEVSQLLFWIFCFRVCMFVVSCRNFFIFCVFCFIFFIFSFLQLIYNFSLFFRVLESCFSWEVFLVLQDFFFILQISFWYVVFWFFSCEDNCFFFFVRQRFLFGVQGWFVFVF